MINSFSVMRCITEFGARILQCIYRDSKPQNQRLNRVLKGTGQYIRQLVRIDSSE